MSESILPTLNGRTGKAAIGGAGVLGGSGIAVAIYMLMSQQTAATQERDAAAMERASLRTQVALVAQSATNAEQRHGELLDAFKAISDKMDDMRNEVARLSARRANRARGEQ